MSQVANIKIGLRNNIIINFLNLCLFCRCRFFLYIFKKMIVERLFEDKEIVLERFENGKYRVTFFNDENHWAGDITFSKDEGVIYDDVKE